MKNEITQDSARAFRRLYARAGIDFKLFTKQIRQEMVEQHHFADGTCEGLAEDGREASERGKYTFSTEEAQLSSNLPSPRPSLRMCKAQERQNLPRIALTAPFLSLLYILSLVLLVERTKKDANCSSKSHDHGTPPLKVDHKI